MKPIWGSALALLTGTAGAGLFWLISAPLPWMLGSMTATAIAAMAGASWAVPRQARDLSRPVIGVLAGSAFTPAIVGQAGSWGVMIAAVILFGIATTLAGTWFFQRIAGYDRATAFFASTPAGLAEMSLMGESLGGNIRALFLIHALRVFAVVLLVPLIAGVGTSPAPAGAGSVQGTPGPADAALLVAVGVVGYWLGRRLRLPNGIMICCMVLSAAVHIAGLTGAAPPGWLVVSVQVVIGCIAGARFAGVTLAELRGTLLFGGIWSAILIGLTVATAALLARLIGIDGRAALLALAPGGMAEMMLVTYALGIEVAMVATCQVLRNACTMLIAPALWRWLPGRRDNV